MPARASIVAHVPADAARRLLLGGKGLLANPDRRATPAAVLRLIRTLGFVQVDTINIVERAHHHILRTRIAGYEPRLLERLLERDRTLFEHWTHDASVIPTEWFRYWKVRFERYKKRDIARRGWWAERMGGDPRRVTAHVRGRIEREGPLMSRDFEHPERNGPWWGWKPQKAALEYLWREGDLAIAARRNFHKVYDLTPRVLPAEQVEAEPPDHDEHTAWACREAIARLGVATPGEIASFMNAVPLADARAWCARAVTTGQIVPVRVESADGSAPRRAFARHDWRRQASRHPSAPAGLRLLSPFDPIVRDRRRALRLFGFDYRFEAFVPEAKRRYGYYVLPMLEGERLVGRLDPKLHRGEGRLEVKGVWWEPPVKATRARRAQLDEAVGAFARSLGVSRWSLPTR